MNTRTIGFPANPAVDQEYQSWVWDGEKWTSVGGGNSGGGGGSYDDTEVRGLIAANESAISANASNISINASDVSDNSDRIDALEQGGGGGGDSFWVEESPGVIKYAGTAKATDLVAG